MTDAPRPERPDLEALHQLVSDNTAPAKRWAIGWNYEGWLALLTYAQRLEREAGEQRELLLDLTTHYDGLAQWSCRICTGTGRDRHAIVHREDCRIGAALAPEARHAD